MAKDPTPMAKASISQDDPKERPEMPVDKPPEMTVQSSVVKGNTLVEDFGNGITVTTFLPNKKARAPQ